MLQTGTLTQRPQEARVVLYLLPQCLGVNYQHCGAPFKLLPATLALPIKVLVKAQLFCC